MAFLVEKVLIDGILGKLLIDGIFGGIAKGVTYPLRTLQPHSFFVKNNGPNEIAVRVYEVYTSKARCGDDPLCVKGIATEREMVAKSAAMKEPIIIPSGIEMAIPYQRPRSLLNPHSGYRLFWVPKADDLHLYDSFANKGTYPYYDAKDLASINKRCLRLPDDGKTIIIDSGRVGGTYKFRVRIPDHSTGKKWVQILQQKRSGGSRRRTALTRPIAISPGKSHLFQIHPPLDTDLFLSWS
jgi:hypothetical protein